MNKAKATTTSNWRDLLPIHPAAELFPPMSPAELDELTEDIRVNGIQNVVATWFDKDEKEWLIDGRNRLNALSRLGYRFSRVPHRAAGVVSTTKFKIRNPNERNEATGQDCTARDNEWVGIHHYRETTLAERLACRSVIHSSWRSPIISTAAI